MHHTYVAVHSHADSSPDGFSLPRQPSKVPAKLHGNLEAASFSK